MYLVDKKKNTVILLQSLSLDGVSLRINGEQVIRWVPLQKNTEELTAIAEGMYKAILEAIHRGDQLFDFNAQLQREHFWWDKNHYKGVDTHA